MFHFSDTTTSQGLILCERACLDRRRLEEAHLKYSILRMYQQYDSYFSKWSLSSNIKQTLEDITPTFYEAFSAYYTCKFYSGSLVNLLVHCGVKLVKLSL